MDQDRRLRDASFKKKRDRYEVRVWAKEGLDEDGAFTALLDEPALMSIRQYLTETEFPVRADAIDGSGCSARVILLWRANSRAFADDQHDLLDIELLILSLRVVLYRGSTVLSNSTYDLSAGFPVHPDRVLAVDMNGDGLKEYGFIGGYQSTAIRIWTLTSTCLFQPLTFTKADASKRFESLNGNGIDVNKVRGDGYSISILNGTPPEEHSEVYRWKSSVGAFVMTRRVEDHKPQRKPN